jgi:hypothetical protein
MKISISIGTLAKTAFEAVIEDGAVVGLSLDGHTLTFDYTDLDNNEALQRAVDNQTAISDKLALLVAGDEDETASKFSYALGYMAVATAALANEQAAQTGLYQADGVAEATMPEISTLDAGDVTSEAAAEPAPSPAPRKRSKEAVAPTA